MKTSIHRFKQSLDINFFTAVSVFAGSIALGLSGCGLTSKNSSDSTTSAQTNPTTTVITTTPTSSVDLGPVVINQGISLYGSSPSTITVPVRTDRYLRVRVSPTEASSNSGTPYIAEYSCASFRVQVQVKGGQFPYSSTQGSESDWYNINGSGTNTELTKVAGTDTCTGGVDARVQDFSGSLSQGHGLVRLKITAMRTNSQCLYVNTNQNQCITYGQMYQDYSGLWYANPANTVCTAVADLLNAGGNYCPSSAVYSTHSVNANVDIGIAPM